MSKSAPWWILLSLLLAGVLIYLLAPILTPFVVSALLAYMANPMIDALARWRVPRTLGVVFLFVVLGIAMVLLLVGLIPLIQRQIMNFAAKLPGYIDWLNAHVGPWLSTTFGLQVEDVDLGSLKEQLTRHWRELGGIAGGLMSGLTASGARLANGLMNLVLIPVVTFYLLRDWNQIMERLPGLLPSAWRAPTISWARDADEVLGAFLRGQLAVMVMLALVYAVGLWIVGLDLALPLGLLAGLVSFVPYLGFIVGIVSAGFAALLQFQDVTVLLWVGAVFAVGQALESMIFTPWLVGDRVGLHPVAVIFAILAGGQLFGFFGILLALPTAAVLLVAVRHLRAGAAARAARSPSGG